MKIETPATTTNPALAAALREMELKKAQGPWPRRIKIMASALVILLVLGGATWAIIARHNATVKASEKAAVVASIQSPRDARRAVEAGQLQWEDLWKLGQERENKRMDEYFALTSQADRNKLLDKEIDDDLARQKER